MKKSTTLLSLVVVASMLLAACGHASTPAPQPIQPKPQPTFLPVDYGEISVSSVIDAEPYNPGRQAGVQVMVTYVGRDPDSVAELWIGLSTSRGTIYLHPNQPVLYSGWETSDFDLSQPGRNDGNTKLTPCQWQDKELRIWPKVFFCPPRSGQ